MPDETRPDDWRARECPYPGREALEAAMLDAELELAGQLTGVPS